ncbi:MAG TPA: DUF4185 domain-containing protein [Bacillaceae bacterium]|nr:DUF4185 domain-containing protein [Bacillaceae bacterium]
MGKHVLAKLSILLIALLLVMVGCSKENAEEKDNENKVVDKTPSKELEEEEEKQETIPSIIDFVRVSEVAQLTGQNSVNKTEERYDVGGTDLGSIFEMDEKLYYVFGDTFGANSTLPPGEGPTTNWRSNVVAYSTDKDPSDGIVLDGFLEEDGVAKELIPSNKLHGNFLTAIPTYGVSVNDNMYLYYMAVDVWGEPGVWATSHAGVYKSADKGETWEKLEDLEWGIASNFTQVAIVKPNQNEAVLGEEIYFYGVKPGRYSNIQLMKVHQNDIENKDKYVYFTGVDEDGNPQWSSEEKDATNMIETTAGELSVVWNEDLQRWLLTYINGTTTNIDLVEAENPWGPWTEPQTMVSQSAYPGLYGSYMHPQFIQNNGKTLYFTMSRWGPYNTFIMKADIVLKEE